MPNDNLVLAGDSALASEVRSHLSKASPSASKKSYGNHSVGSHNPFGPQGAAVPAHQKRGSGAPANFNSPKARADSMKTSVGRAVVVNQPAKKGARGALAKARRGDLSTR
jgi:hypothetical protein